MKRSTRQVSDGQILIYKSYINFIILRISYYQFIYYYVLNLHLFTIILDFLIRYVLLEK